MSLNPVSPVPSKLNETMNPKTSSAIPTLKRHWLLAFLNTDSMHIVFSLNNIYYVQAYDKSPQKRGGLASRIKQYRRDKNDTEQFMRRHFSVLSNGRYRIHHWNGTQLDGKKAGKEASLKNGAEAQKRWEQ